MRRSCPQMPIRKYMGTSITSQNTKKRMRSRARKTPIMPVSSTSSMMKNSFTRVRMLSHEASMAMGVRNVVRITSHRLRPSTPMW